MIGVVLGVGGSLAHGDDQLVDQRHQVAGGDLVPGRRRRHAFAGAVAFFSASTRPSGPAGSIPSRPCGTSNSLDQSRADRNPKRERGRGERRGSTHGINVVVTGRAYHLAEGLPEVLELPDASTLDDAVRRWRRTSGRADAGAAARWSVRTPPGTLAAHGRPALANGDELVLIAPRGRRAAGLGSGQPFRNSGTESGTRFSPRRLARVIQDAGTGVMHCRRNAGEISRFRSAKARPFAERADNMRKLFRGRCQPRSPERGG